jgi:hypothetical protein
VIVKVGFAPSKGTSSGAPGTTISSIASGQLTAARPSLLRRAIEPGDLRRVIPTDPGPLIAAQYPGAEFRGRCPRPDLVLDFLHLAGRMVMRRREFIAALGGAAAWPRVARAQQSGQVRRVGVLMSVEEDNPDGKTQLSRFTEGLAETGWIDGRNLHMEVRWGGGDVNRTRIFAKEWSPYSPR